MLNRVGWGCLASRNGDHFFKKIKSTLYMGSHVNTTSQAFRINQILKKGWVLRVTTN